MSEGAKTGMIAALALAAGVGGTLLATQSAAVTGTSVSTTDRTAIEAIVREYILTHPEILPEAMQNLERREAAKQVGGNRAKLETAFAGAWQGAADADVTLVEFFDYSCGYCRAARPDVDKLLAEDPKLRVVYRELPILGEDSQKAALISLAVAKQGEPAYAAFHKAMWAAGRPSAATVEQAVRTAGLDPATVQAAANAGDVRAEINSNLALQRSLALSGTPSWVVGDTVINGAVGYDELKTAIAEARKAK
jgi:protein-disulfide isomerase